MSTVRLITVMTEAVDSLELMIGILSNDNGKIFDGVSGIEIIGSSHGGEVTEQNVSIGVIILQKSGEQFRCLLSAAASQIFEHAKNCFTAGTDTEDSSPLKELQFSEEESERYFLDSSSTQFTLSAKYSGYGHY